MKWGLARVSREISAAHCVLSMKMLSCTTPWDRGWRTGKWGGIRSSTLPFTQKSRIVLHLRTAT